MAAEGISSEFQCATSTYNYGFEPWMTPDVCDWYGVACSAESHIVALCLVNNNMNGTLVGLVLPYLTYLTITFAPLMMGELPVSYATTLPLITFMSVFPLAVVKLDLFTHPRKQQFR